MAPAERPRSGGAAQFARYCGVGGAGFVVDAGMLYALMAGLEWGPGSARGVSITLAILVTWALNRRWTFGRGRRRGWAELLLYAAANAVGAGLNFAVYSLALLVSGRDSPAASLAALVLASGVALVFNFAVNKWIVFASGADSPHPT